MSRQTRYFEKFPLTEYNGVPSLNITKRVSFNEKVKNFITAFYTQTLPTGESIETVAYNYYDDVDYDWLIYHANDIVDPYYQVSLDYDEFDNYIIKKYGSLRTAKRKTIHYKNNYESDSRVLSTSAYNSLLGNVKKYWKPVLSQVGIAGYERDESEFVVSTNKIETFDLVSISGTFTKDEIVIRDDDSDSFAEITAANTTNLIIHHVRGDFSGNTNYTVTGEESGATATVNAASVAVLNQVIPNDEEEGNETVYFSPVSFYEYEENLNEQRREIYLVDATFREKLNLQLKELMK